jgi:hypothetical protein
MSLARIDGQDDTHHDEGSNRRPAPPLAVVESSAGYRWATVGTAFDYRLRFLIKPDAALDELVALKGATILWSILRSSALPPRGYSELIQHLSTLLASCKPAALGGPEAEHRLAEACLLLAMYEECYRRPPMPDWPLPAAGPEAGLSALLCLCREAETADVARLAEIAIERQPRLLRGAEVVLNPTFAGSAQIGGGDADLVVRQRLIDIKTVKEPTQRVRERVWQLTGYVLLDWDDQHHLEEAGLYFARHGVCMWWPLQEMIDHMAGESLSLTELRDGFREIVGELPRSAAS